MIFRTAAAGFALLVVLLLALFFRSMYAADLVRYRTGAGTYVEIATIPSQLRISHGSNWPIAQPLEWNHGPYQSLGTTGVGHHLMQSQSVFTIDSQPYRVGDALGGVNRVNVSTIAVPFPSLILLATLPLLLMWGSCKLNQKRVESRRKSGLCVKCGYDLRANIGRCPECGSAFQIAGWVFSNCFRSLAWRCQ